MGKQIKQLEMAALKKTFQDVRDCVLLSASGIDCTTDNHMRLALRKKNIRLQLVKNSLARLVFDELGMKCARYWEGPTLIAWGASSLAELSRELDALSKKNDKLKFKGALSEGQAIEFAQALKMPTRLEAAGRVVSLALSPAQRLLGQILAPASIVAGQIKQLAEKELAEKEQAPPAG